MNAKTRNAKLQPSTSSKSKNSTTSVKPEKQSEAQSRTDSNDGCTSAEEMWQAFEVELKWCVEQLELELSSKKCSQKQFESVSRALKVLTNPNAPLIKKRQLMRASFGDYRQKMKEEEVKFKRDIKKINVYTVGSKGQKGMFIKKCASQQNCTQEVTFNPDSNVPSSDSENSSFSFKKSDNSFTFDFFPIDVEELNNGQVFANKNV